MVAKNKQKIGLMTLPPELIRQNIYLVRGQKVMLDADLAGLYGVETRVLKQAIRRNRDRFPSDFMFELTRKEMEIWRSHFVTSNPSRKMSMRHPPFAFTENGVAMLSGVLKSKRAIRVNIAIMRTFTQLRQLVSNNKELAERVERLEGQVARVFYLLSDEYSPKKPIGFGEQ